MTERRERVRTSVLGAALDLLDEVGVQGLTFESVAARSGVAKTTIYRHWPTKAQLTIEALSIMHEPTPTPNSGDLRADLRACFVAVSEQALDDRKARIFASVLDAAQRDPEYARLHTQMTAEKSATTPDRARVGATARSVAVRPRSRRRLRSRDRSGHHRACS